MGVLIITVLLVAAPHLLLHFPRYFISFIILLNLIQDQDQAREDLFCSAEVYE